MEPVHQAAHEAEGGFLVELLQRAGIEAHLDGHFDVLVPAADRERALEIIDAAAPEHESDAIPKPREPMFEAVGRTLFAVAILAALAFFPLSDILDGTATLGTWFQVAVGLVVLYLMRPPRTPDPHEEWKRYAPTLTSRRIGWTKTHIEAHPWRTRFDGHSLRLRRIGDSAAYVVRIDGVDVLTVEELPPSWTVPHYGGVTFGPPRFAVEDDPVEEGWTDEEERPGTT